VHSDSSIGLETEVEEIFVARTDVETVEGFNDLE
jgi:hypothetical protein